MEFYNSKHHCFLAWNPFSENLLENNPEKALAIVKAIRSNNIRQFKKIYEATNMKNPMIRKFGTNSDTAMNYAAKYGKFDIFKIISDNVKDMQRKDSTGATPLHYAAKKGYLSLVKYITNCLRNINPATDDGRTSMHWAAEGGQVEIIDFYIDKLDDKNPALNESIQSNLIKIRRFNFDEFKLNSIPVFDYMTPLHSAAQRGHLEIVKAITNVLIDKNPKDAHGYTPLHAASSFGHLSTVEYLLTFEENVNVQTDAFWKKRTPLHSAVLYGHLNVVKFLISKGADTELKNSDNKTVFDIATENKNGAIYRALLKGSNRTNRFNG